MRESSARRSRSFGSNTAHCICRSSTRRIITTSLPDALDLLTHHLDDGWVSTTVSIGE